jgi:quercetin dioxygenase-like cupin family protein
MKGTTMKTNYRDHIGTREGKHYKDTLFAGEGMMLGINCLEPGQTQPVHDHADQDKAYIVMEGQGTFTVGEETLAGEAGDCIWAPMGVVHGVTNTSDKRLVVLVCIAPPPG